MDMVMKDVLIRNIRVIENHRTNIQKTHLDELMQSIKQHGLLQPIGVSMDGKSKYILKYGHRRLLACQKLGHKTISAMVTGKVDDDRLLIENITENIQRKDPSFAEYGRIISKLESQLSLSEIAVRIGLSLQKVQSIVRVYKEIPEHIRKKVFFMEKGTSRKKIPAAFPRT